MGTVEFLDEGDGDDAGGDADGLHGGDADGLHGGPGGDDPAAAARTPRRPAGSRGLLAAGAVGTLVLAAFVARSTGGGTAAPSPSASVTSTELSAPSVLGPSVQAVPGLLSEVTAAAHDAGTVYLAGCSGCARVPRVSTGTLRALARVMPAPAVSGAYTVVSATTGRVFSRGLTAHGGGGRLTVEITQTIEGPEYTATRTVGRVVVAEVQHAGYHVTVRAYGLRIPAGALLRLAASPALFRS